MYADDSRSRWPSRLIGGTVATLLQLAILIMVWTGFSSPAMRTGGQGALTALDLRHVPPPPPPAAPRRTHAASGRAAPAHIRSHAAALVAPAVVALKPPPVPAAIVAGTGIQPAAGAAPLPGPGWGAGGQGQGNGSGNNGDGEGSGGRDAELVRGRIKDADIPAALRNTAFSGTTRTEIGVGSRGEVTACRMLSSSGNRQLDDLTCRLVFERFRFHPAVDAHGQPQRDTIIYEQDWVVSGQFDDDPKGH